ncbi:GTPase [Streptomyces sparsogenes]|uniref:GTPase n=1 Tax=Streptomyces sparsogenes TaxID=67365 RepID=UPI0033E6A8F9
MRPDRRGAPVSAGCHGTGHGHATADQAPRIALVGSPNSGKSSVFNGLTGLNAKTGRLPRLLRCLGARCSSAWSAGCAADTPVCERSGT